MNAILIPLFASPGDWSPLEATVSAGGAEVCGESGGGQKKLEKGTETFIN